MMIIKKINKKGSIIITTLLICMIITIVIATFHNLVFEDYLTVQSNVNSIKAYYLAESAIDILFYELNIVCEEAIEEYFEELRDYKNNYINLDEKGEYTPPVFENILKHKIIVSLPSFNKLIENPFISYNHNHSYKITVDYVVSYNIIKADIIGSYLHARKLLTVEYSLPAIFYDEVDEYNLPKSKIRPLKVSKIYQNLSI